MAALLLAPACSVVSPLTMAQVSANTASVATTGKGVHDHLLSAVREEDCVIARGARFEKVCQPPGDGPSDASMADSEAEPATSALGDMYGRPTVPMFDESGGAQPYFLIASFSRRADAGHVAKAFVNPGAVVADSRIDGTPYHRVVVGPVRDGTENRLRAALATAGVTPQRIVMLCEDSLDDPPCAPPPVPATVERVIAER